jgi:hypothetical protein
LPISVSPARKTVEEREIFTVEIKSGEMMGWYKSIQLLSTGTRSIRCRRINLSSPFSGSTFHNTNEHKPNKMRWAQRALENRPNLGKQWKRQQSPTTNLTRWSSRGVLVVLQGLSHLPPVVLRHLFPKAPTTSLKSNPSCSSSKYSTQIKKSWEHPMQVWTTWICYKTRPFFPHTLSSFSSLSWSLLFSPPPHHHHHQRPLI